jgi:hypothetical protein
MPNQKKWTFMVYMAGDNSLNAEGPIDLKEMKKVGSGDKINVLAQLDRATGHVSERYYLRKGTKLAADSVSKLGKINMGDPKRLKDFVSWGVKNYPSDHYALVLWNHGNGWDDTDIYAGERHRSVRRLATGPVRHALFHQPARRLLAKAKSDITARGILYDDDAKDFLDNQELEKVLADTKKLLKRNLDVLGMDACLMSMAEVGYQVKGSTNYAVGSEQTEPGEGWPYDTVLTGLAKNPDMTPRDFSKLIVTKYCASYGSGDAVTQSACDLAKAEALAGAVKALTQILQIKVSDLTVRQQILLARTQAQSYEIPDNIDLADFCALLAQAIPGSEIAARCQNVITAVTSAYVVANGSKGTSLRNSHGVAIYFPTEMVSPLYAKLNFCAQTGWNAFLEEYLRVIRSRRSVLTARAEGPVTMISDPKAFTERTPKAEDIQPQ